MSIQSTLLFDDDKTMGIIYSFWRQNRFNTHSTSVSVKCVTSSSSPSLSRVLMLLTQSPRPNGWLFDCVKSRSHSVREQPEELNVVWNSFWLIDVLYTVHIDVHKQFYTSVCWMCSSTQLEYNKSVFIAMPILMPTQRWEMRWCLHYVALAHKCVMFFFTCSFCFLSYKSSRKFIFHSVVCFALVCVCVCVYRVFSFSFFFIAILRTHIVHRRKVHIHRHISVSQQFHESREIDWWRSECAMHCMCVCILHMPNTNRNSNVMENILRKHQ